MRMPRSAAWAVVVATLLIAGASAQNKDTFNFAVGPGASVSIVNPYGSITVLPSSGNQVVVSAQPHSEKAKADTQKDGTQVRIRTTVTGKPTPEESQVDYKIEIPENATLTVRAVKGPISLHHLTGDVTVESENAAVDMGDANAGHIRVRSMDGSVTLSHLAHVSIEVITVGGDVVMSDVAGPMIAVSTTSGRVQDRSDFGDDGEYDLTTASGTIDVVLPANASVDLTARSVSGSVDDQFHLKQQQNSHYATSPRKSLVGTTVGTTNEGRSRVNLRSFSGNIIVEKAK